ncbi:hypothetical protein J6590_032980 [Homalodisca vitripennis]|nr:hypothetical protein J6590_032980 [Homalodisca vitripennis]
MTTQTVNSNKFHLEVRILKLNEGYRNMKGMRKWESGGEAGFSRFLPCMLGLTDEEIIGSSACNVCATIIINSVAAWYCELIISRLE